MARYVKFERVKVRLEGKVRFGAPGDNDPNKMTAILLADLINEAESQLELDLMIRYGVPFIDKDAGTFEGLNVSTRTLLTTLGELLSCIRILEMDFGRGTATNSEKYTEKLQKRYDALVAQLVEVKKDSYQTWLRPPLEGLALAYSNQGDTGFRARIHNTTTISHGADYAYKQINSPGENIFNGVLDPLDPGNVNG